ncbi:MAG: hypothetical protein WAK93_14565, partial [Solirubrobacteraceae bacterium]
GTLGGTLATVLIGLGLVLAVSLVFYEVGLTEDRDRAEHPPPGGPEADHGADPRHGPESHPGHESHPTHEGMRRRPPDRMRGRRRRLR